MPSIVPLTSNPTRTRCVLGDNSYIIENYYLPTIKKWLIDIYNDEGVPLIVGICLQTGIDNLVKDKSIEFEGQALKYYSVDNTKNDLPNRLGNTCFLIYFSKDEVKARTYIDKMLDDNVTRFLNAV